MSKPIIQKLKSRNITILSMPNGKYPLSADKQDLMCLTSDYTLVICSGERANREVLAYKELLRRKGVTLRAELERGIVFLRDLYSELGKEEGRIHVVDPLGADTKRQAEVVRLITDAVRRKASDIHITIFKDRGTIAYRIHGDLYRVQEPPADKTLEMCSAIYQSMCDVADTNYKPHLHQDARMSGEFVNKCGLFGARIASAPTDAGSRMVIRLLYDSGAKIPTLEELFYLPEQIRDFNVMRRQTSGINLLSGATGSGKSTTLVSVMSTILRDAKRRGVASNLVGNDGVQEFLGVSVVTIEDPPEYKIEGATQTPLKADKSDEASIRRAWAKAISACMRQDPDIMMIGEIRDQGSARAAFDAAMTGHGVWTTVHTTDAVGIMTRLEGLEVERDRMLDPEIVTGLINQSLAQRLCPHCSVPWNEGGRELVIDEGQRQRIEAYCHLPGVRLRGKGCSHCSGTGIVGRMVIAEVILPNFTFMEVFSSKGKTAAKAYWVKEMRGITKCMALIRRINEGFVDPRDGESKVSPLDKDKTTLDIDYSHEGAFTQAYDIIAPHVTSAEYARIEAQRNAAQASNADGLGSSSQEWA